MKLSRFAILLFLGALILVSVNSAKAATEWNPKRTWVFFVGLVQWKDSESFEPFDEKIRKDGILLNSLRKRGVPEDHIVYLKDSAATTAVVETRFADFLKRAAPDDWILVYFEGHGYKTDADVPYWRRMTLTTKYWVGNSIRCRTRSSGISKVRMRLLPWIIVIRERWQMQSRKQNAAFRMPY